MSDFTTRITDLPENITIKMPVQQQSQQSPQQHSVSFDQQMQGVNYTPLNIHPNPYGVSNGDHTNLMPPPQQPTSGMAGYLSPDQQAQLSNIPQMRLPSRDIPIDQTHITTDAEIQPNYIPKPKLTSDYIKQYDQTTEEKIKQHEDTKKRESLIDTIITEIQTPALVCFLFIISQMPITNSLLYKNFSFMSIHNIDGSLNFYGIVFKSIIFASIYYGAMRSIDYISEIV